MIISERRFIMLKGLMYNQIQFKLNFRKSIFQVFGLMAVPGKNLTGFAGEKQRTKK